MLRQWKRWGIFSGLAVIGLVLLLQHHPAWVERYYARGIYPYITLVLTQFFSRIPVSITELTIYAGFLGLPASIFLVLTGKISLKKWLFTTIALAGLVISWFYLAWGLNYFRQPLYQNLGMNLASQDSTFFRQVLHELIDQTNRHYLPLGRVPKNQVDVSIETGYKSLAAELPIFSTRGRRRPKTFLLNTWLNKTLTSGFFSPLFHEIHLNADLLPFEYPFVLAHEKAHQLGFANEAEASFLAFLVCSQSEDDRLQYSAYLITLRRFLARARVELHQDRAIHAGIRQEVLNDIRLARRHWARYAGRISRFSYKAYDRYLKSNKISEGVNNYAGVVDYVLGWYKMRK